jgi:hypothetical protein
MSLIGFESKEEAEQFASEKTGMLSFALVHEKSHYGFHPKGIKYCLSSRSIFNKYCELDWGSWKKHELPEDTPAFLVEVMVDGH